MNTGLRIIRTLTLSLAMQGIFFGCASSGLQTVGGQAPEGFVTRFSTSRAGEVQLLSWKSEPGALYTVLFNDGAGKQWLPLPQAGLVRGTGKMITVRDQVPETVKRRYRVRIRQPGAGK